MVYMYASYDFIVLFNCIPLVYEIKHIYIYIYCFPSSTHNYITSHLYYTMRHLIVVVLKVYLIWLDSKHSTVQLIVNSKLL